ncbi:hypothetical protein FE391_39725 [Nonomuraea sp. KC401]|uniref:hypothetical protein n=1 Tax=unclassified Nonomuraea TaxID=2593643 RepID=UPI0010FDBE40|nr:MULTISPECIES: hypothetical protein [unclassified Nonomuraea]NBE93309.1 hypothetical protein [Nonomuraea sp. K271]TLF56195.1 hypothetical protein FE391_39725 [Nonomuraea sp. KC401]
MGVVARLSTVTAAVSLGAAAGLASPAGAAAMDKPPPGCTVAVKTMENHSVGMRTMVGRATVKCKSMLRPQISLSLHYRDKVKAKGRKDCGKDLKCVAWTDTVFRAQGGNDWCTLAVVNWGGSETMKWDCL